MVSTNKKTVCIEVEKLICLLSYIIYNYNSIPSTSLSIIVLQVKLASSRVYISKIPSPTAYPILARAGITSKAAFCASSDVINLALATIRSVLNSESRAHIKYGRLG